MREEGGVVVLANPKEATVLRVDKSCILLRT